MPKAAAAKPEKKEKKEKKVKDPNAPKKPLGAYMFYCAEQRPTIKAKNPELKVSCPLLRADMQTLQQSATSAGSK